MLPAELLTRRNQLPAKPAPVTLTGRFVRLEPLVVERDAAPLYAVSEWQPDSRSGAAPMGPTMLTN